MKTYSTIRSYSIFLTVLPMFIVHMVHAQCNVTGLSPSSLSFTSSGGTKTTSVSFSGQSCTLAFSVSAMATTWLSVSQLNPNTIQVVCQPNTGTARTGVVTYIFNGNGRTFFVNQSAGAAIRPSTPNNPSVIGSSCGQVTLRRGGTPPSNVTWYWQGKNANGSKTNLGSGSTFTASEGSGTYYIRARANNGLWSNGSGSVFVEVPTVPPLSVMDGQNNCSPEIVLTAVTTGIATGIEHRWYDSDMGGNYILGNPSAAGPDHITQLVVTGQSRDYWVSAVHEDCESPRKKVTATYVNDVPPVLTLSDSSEAPSPSNSPGELCGQATFALFAEGGGSGSTYEWYDAPSGGTLIHRGSGFSPTLSYDQTDNGQKTYYVGGTLKSVRGCDFPISPMRSITVTVKQTPPEPLLTNVSPPTCSNPNGRFTISNFNGSPASYAVSPSTGVSISGTGLVTAPTGTYTVRATVNGCTSVVSQPIQISSQPVTPPAPTLGPVTHPTCENPTGSFAITNFNGDLSSYTVDPTSGVSISDTGIVTASIETYTVTVSLNGCTSVPPIPVVIDSAPAINIYYLDRDNDGFRDPGSEGEPDCGTRGSGWTLREIEDLCPDLFDPTNSPPRTWYLDADGDGHAISSQISCENPGTGWTDQQLSLGDCDDNSYSPTNDCTSASPLNNNPADYNYVYTRTYQAPGYSSSPAFFTTNGDLVQQITYFDGLGRPKQQIAIQQNPDGKDIITHIGYDTFSRQEKEWLPITDTIQAADFGYFVTSNMEELTGQYYLSAYTNDFPGIVDPLEANPYSEKEFESSPMNRVQKQAAPGHDWAMGQDHEIVLDYATKNNGDGVRQFEVTTMPVTHNTVTIYVPSLIENGDYGVGELHKNITYDENHNSGKNHTTEEFTNKQGQVVLKRTYADVPALDRNDDGDTLDPGEEARPQEPHDTYYVYDDYGNLTYVLPPKMEASTESLANINSNLEELGYQYVYDHRNRLVEKKLPGKGWEYIVYDKLDRPIMTQDANQRDTGTDLHEWLFTKYDAFGRVAYTGKATSANTVTRQEVQGDVDALTVPWEVHTATLDASNDYGGTTVHYTNGAYPNNSTPNRLVDLDEVLTINYYDGYDVTWAEMGTSITSFGIGSTAKVKGLTTGSKIKTLDVAGSEVWTTTATYYDEKARPIYTHTRNAYLGTVDITITKLDFVGRPQKVRTAHTRNGTTIVTIDNFAYDHVGRLLNQTQCIGDATLGDTCNSAIGGTSLVFSTPVTGSRTDIAAGSITLRPGFHVVAAPGLSYTAKIEPHFAGELIVYNNYDELGQLVRKKVGGSPGATYDAAMGLQTVKYAYNVRGWLKSINNPTNLGSDLWAMRINYNDPNHGGTALFNGNMSETEWRTANTDNSLKWYRYGFDSFDRMTSAIGNSTSYNVSNISYDKNGNILSLNRQGHTNAGATSFGAMDILDYDYDSGNKLMKVTDTGNDTYGFRDGTNTNDDFGYDQNGNINLDRNKGITGITYNHLNMPTQINFGGNNIQYVYSADGTKLKKTVSDGATTEYANGYVYENNTLQFFNHEEGYVTPDGSGGYDYVYQFRDHVDNIRLSYTENNGTLEIVEENNFYPFGMKMKGYNGNVSPLGNSMAKKFKYQGQELNEGLGYNMHEFELRHYDSAIGRFVTTDPYEQFQSPYLAMGNNPVLAFDPDGGNCFDANGNQIACPNEDIYDDFRDNDDNHITVFDEVTVTPEDNNQGIEVAGDLNDNGLQKIVPDKFSAIFDLKGIDHTLAEIELNLTGSRTVTHLNAKIEVDAYGNVVRGPIQGGAGGLEFLSNPVSGVKVVTSARSIVKAAKLPISGKIRFIPRPSDVKSGKILKKNGGFVDKFGNIWQKGPSRTKGQAFEWDVQLSATGKAQLEGLSRDGRHLNVSLDGKITH